MECRWKSYMSTTTNIAFPNDGPTYFMSAQERERSEIIEKLLILWNLFYSHLDDKSCEKKIYLCNCCYRWIFSGIIPRRAISIVIIHVLSIALSKYLTIVCSLIWENCLANATPANTTTKYYTDYHTADDVTDNFAKLLEWL